MLDDLWSFVTDDVTVGGLVGNRMFLGKLQQGAAFPAISYSIISEVRGHVMDGPDGLPGTRVQITAWATTAGAARQLEQAILSRLESYRGLLDGPGSTEVQGIFADTLRTSYEEGPELHRFERDYFVHHEE